MRNVWWPSMENQTASRSRVFDPCASLRVELVVYVCSMSWMQSLCCCVRSIYVCISVIWRSERWPKASKLPRSTSQQCCTWGWIGCRIILCRRCSHILPGLSGNEFKSRGVVGLLAVAVAGTTNFISNVTKLKTFGELGCDFHNICKMR